MQNITIPIEGYHFYDLALIGNIWIEISIYDQYNGVDIGYKDIVIWINSNDFELPPLQIDWNTLSVTYYDIETDTNQTSPSGAVDLIFVDFIYQQKLTGYFIGHGYYSASFVSVSSGNYNDDEVENVAGTYNHRLIFESEELSDFADPTDTTTTYPVDTTTSDTSSLEETTSSTDTTSEVPTIDLPAPSLYFSLLSVFTSAVIIKKKR